MFTVPTAVAALLQRPCGGRGYIQFGGCCLWLCPFASGVIQAFPKGHGCGDNGGYGMTEATCFGLLQSKGWYSQDWLGRYSFSPHTDVQIMAFERRSWAGFWRLVKSAKSVSPIAGLISARDLYLARAGMSGFTRAITCARAIWGGWMRRGYLWITGPREGCDYPWRA